MTPEARGQNATIRAMPDRPDQPASGAVVEGPPVRTRTIRGVDTSVAAFVGAAARPAGDPGTAVTSMADFERVHGDGRELTFGGAAVPDFLWHGARAFFANGGRRLHVVPVVRRDGAAPRAADYEAALGALDRVEGISIVAAPGSTFAPVQVDARDTEARMHALLRHAERADHRLALLDPPDGLTPAEVRALRRGFDSPRGALYYPWVQVATEPRRPRLHLPPSPFLAGVLARVDAERGVHAVPANETLQLAAGLERTTRVADVELLNPEGINCLRHVRGRGIVVAGARTVSSDPEWKYLSVRRLVDYLERSFGAGLDWLVFEPNTAALWAAVRASLEAFLTQVWQRGALQGRTVEEAFFVRCDRTTMTQADIDEGRLVCQVGVAPLRPAEFVIFRIGQKTADARS